MTLATAPVPQQDPAPDGPAPKIKQRRFSRHDKIFAVVASVVLMTIALAWIYPYIWMLSASIKTNSEIFSSLNLFTDVLQVKNWLDAWHDADMGRYFFNSIFITLFSTIISVLTAALMGYAMGRYRFIGKKVVIAVFALVIFLPEGYTIIPVYDLVNQLGLTDSLWGVTLAESGGAHIVVVLLFAGYFAQLPKELEESARVDGAGFLRIFARVYLPLAKPVTATAIILNFMHSWNAFLLPLVLTLSRPDLRPLAVGVYALRSSAATDSNWGVITASSAMTIIPIVLVFLCLQRYFV